MLTGFSAYRAAARGRAGGHLRSRPRTPAEDPSLAGAAFQYLEEVLSFATGVRHREEELERAFFSARFVRVLDSLGYATFRRWGVYGEEALAGREAGLWLAAESLTVEHAGEPLSRYAAEFSATTGKPEGIARPVLFGTAIALAQPRLFGLEVLGEGGWLKALKLEDYAPRQARPGSLQQSLFPYHEAWG